MARSILLWALSISILRLAPVLVTARPSAGPNGLKVIMEAGSENVTLVQTMLTVSYFFSRPFCPILPYRNASASTWQLSASKAPKGSLYTIPKVIQNAALGQGSFEYWGTNAYFTR
jgi:hypothetical protein